VAVLLALIVALIAAPPLSERQQRDLASAQDGLDHHEQAFFALVESVRGWREPSAAGSDDEPIRLAPDLAALLERPADFRGDLCRITGELLQQTTLAPPYEDVSEWFVRESRTGQPVIIYVVKPNSSQTFADRQHVQIDGRFYKRMRFTARDRKTRDYPAFVGRFPILVAPPATQSGSPIAPGPGGGGRGLDLLAIIAGPVAVLAIVLAGMRMWISRKSRLRQRERHGLHADGLTANGGAVDEAEGLPDDPVEALAELRRRAVSSTSSAPSVSDSAARQHAGDHGQPAE
jgi:hypothetical protein